MTPRDEQPQRNPIFYELETDGRPRKLDISVTFSNEAHREPMTDSFSDLGAGGRETESPQPDHLWHIIGAIPEPYRLVDQSAPQSGVEGACRGRCHSILAIA